MTDTICANIDAFALSLRSVAQWEQKHGRDELAKVIESAAHQIAALRSENEALTKALTDLRLTARVLLQNAEGCAVNHHGADFELHGPPGWLADCENVIAQAEAALQSPPLKEPNQ